MQNLAWGAATFALVLGFAVGFSLAAARWDRFAGDLGIAREIQGWPQPTGVASEAVRAVTSTEVAVIAGVIMVAVLLLMRRLWPAIGFAVLFIALPLVQRGVKMAVDRPRPAADLLDVRGTATSESFPSGHVMSGTVMLAAIVAMCWLLPVPRWLRWVVAGSCGAVAVVGGVANVYEGVHWPSDVMGGFAWAAALLIPFATFVHARLASTSRPTLDARGGDGPRGCREPRVDSER